MALETTIEHCDQPGRQAGLAKTYWCAFKKLLARPVDGGSLAMFRICLGLVMALEAYSLCRPNESAISTGESPIRHYYAGPNITFHFPYSPFEWLPSLNEKGMYVVAAVQALAGIAFALGWWYRASALAVFLSWGYFFAIESTRSYWQSHYYLELLLCFLMLWMPAARRYSLAKWQRGDRGTDTIPFWCVLLLRGQLVIAYFYAGVAKINRDWLLDAVPVRWFLAEPNVTAPYKHWMGSGLFEHFQQLVHSVWFAYVLSYTGLVFDLAGGFLLLFRRTRIFALALMVIFHAANHFLIFRDIGWFPLVGVTTALIFLEPDWPKRVWNWLRHPNIARPDWKWFCAGAVAFPVIGGLLGWKFKPSSGRPAQANLATNGGGVAALVPYVPALFLLWLASQALIPLRQYAIPGDARFTYEGLSFSWRLKSEVHSARVAEFRVHDGKILVSDSGKRWKINWDQWHGERTVYRVLSPGTLRWQTLPELVVALDPLSGERIFYNHFASTAAHSEPEARQRILEIWQRLYGRSPRTITRTRHVSQILNDLSDGLKAAGDLGDADQAAALVPLAQKGEKGGLSPAESRAANNAVLALLESLHLRDAAGTLTSLLRTMDPFALAGQQSSMFLLIEDPTLYAGSPPSWPVLNPELNKTEAVSPSPSGIEGSYGSDSSIVYLSGELGGAAKLLLPQASIFERQGSQGPYLYIFWNAFLDINESKLDHISNQAFYLRRYARRVAGLWEKMYRRRPKVSAVTAVSLNGRPFQPLVNPDTDLASVPLVWFGHNPWIEDLKTPRVPRQALNHNSGWFAGEY